MKKTYISLWILMLLLVSNVLALNDDTLLDGWDSGATLDSVLYGIEVNVDQELTVTEIHVATAGNCNSCGIFNGSSYVEMTSGSMVGDHCTVNFVMYPGQNYFIISNEDEQTCSNGVNDAVASFPYDSVSNGDFNVVGGCADTTLPLDSGCKNGAYIWDIQNITYTLPSGPVNNDHIAFTDITNVTGSNSVYFNFTTNGNYSYTEWYQNNVLKANNSLKIHNFTGLSNVTYYLFNISIYWNSTLFNKTSFNISTLQSTQVSDFGQTNVTQLNDIHTKISYIYEVLEMLPLVLLYAIFMFMGYWLITSNNFYLGVLLLVNTLGMDFYFVRYIYTTYIEGVSTTGWQGSFIYVFAISLIVWILVKVGSIVMVKGIRKAKI